MFELAKRIANAKYLSDVFVIAQQALKDFVGDKELTDDEKTAFATELSEVVSAFLSDKGDISVVYTLTPEDKMSAVTAARNEEKALADERVSSVQAELNILKAEKETLLANLNTANETIATIEKEKSEQALQNKVDAFITDIVKAGISLTDSMKKNLSILAVAKLDKCEKEEDEKVVLDEIKNDMIATAKQSNLEDASRIMGSMALGGDKDSNMDLEAKLQKVREDSKKENN